MRDLGLKHEIRLNSTLLKHLFLTAFYEFVTLNVVERSALSFSTV